MSTYSIKLLHKANGYTRITIETIFVNEEKVDSFVDRVIELLKEYDVALVTEHDNLVG